MIIELCLEIDMFILRYFLYKELNTAPTTRSTYARVGILTDKLMIVILMIAEYAALLTPRSSSLIKSSSGLGEPMSSGLAAGRFMFLHKSLYYSFTHNQDLVRPKFVQFVDSEGNVVEEQEVTLNNYQHETKKICGVWQKIPRVYRKLLKEEKLYAALVTEKINGDNDRFLAGRVSKQRYVTNELYSALLEPSSQMVSN